MKRFTTYYLFKALFVLALLPLNSALAQFNSSQEVRALPVGTKAPVTSLVSGTGEKVSLQSLIKDTPSVIIFFRGSWCPYCNLHLGELQKIEKELTGLGFQILAISPDSAQNIATHTSKLKLNYKLFSDKGAQAAQAFRLAYKVDKETYETLLGYGINLEEASGESHRLLPVPAAFVVDKKGTIRFSYANPDYKIRVETKKLLETAKQLSKN